MIFLKEVLESCLRFFREVETQQKGCAVVNKSSISGLDKVAFWLIKHEINVSKIKGKEWYMRHHDLRRK